jgi:serine/threonine-protein kinase RsbW
VSKTATPPAALLRVPSRTEFLAVAREATRHVAELSGFDTTQAEQISLAVEEAATNAIEHAYAGAGDRAIEIVFEYRGARLCIDVADEGATVDPRSVPEVDLQRYATERRKGGLGVHLMGKIMDSVSFRRSGRKNVCCLEKKRPADGPKAGS